jgi:ribosomal protein S18 acetylase RimI-like enzyme
MQKSSVDDRLCNELEKIFQTERCEGAVVDVENKKPAGVRFVEDRGFKEAESYV